MWIYTSMCLGIDIIIVWNIGTYACLKKDEQCVLSLKVSLSMGTTGIGTQESIYEVLRDEVKFMILFFFSLNLKLASGY